MVVPSEALLPHSKNVQVEGIQGIAASTFHSPKSGICIWTAVYLWMSPCEEQHVHGEPCLSLEGCWERPQPLSLHAQCVRRLSLAIKTLKVPQAEFQRFCEQIKIKSQYNSRGATVTAALQQSDLYVQTKASRGLMSHTRHKKAPKDCQD